MKRLALSLCVILFGWMANAAVRLPRLFGDSMVLQRDASIPVWGWADKGEKVTVQLNGQSKTVRTGKDGKWKVSLSAIAAGGPYQLVVKGKNTITLSDVMIGDVWVCSGQSNMEFHVNGVRNAAQEIASAHYPGIRHIYIPKAVASTPQYDLAASSSWQPATPENVGDFTAVGYFFARDLYNELQIPIGLIHTSWGGTDIETWISRKGMEGSDEFATLIKGMPNLNLDSLAAIRKQTLQTKITALQGSLPDAATAASWSQPGTADANWPQMTLPGLWETTALPDVDGVVWFRKEITLSAAEAAMAAELHLGMIDDMDETYINGAKVGGTNGYNLARVYKIPAGVLKEGKNVIAVRVTDTGGGGGIYGDAADVKLMLGTTARSLAGPWRYKVASVSATGTTGPNSYPTLLYNAMIQPLIPFAIKGAIWYQGENNAGRAYQYRTAFPLMITDWRKQWGEGDFPFYFVQLASYNAGNGNSKNGSNWAELREAQTKTLSLPHTGMAVTIDIGESNDIHPKNKQDVGKRLAAVALHDTYGKDIVYSGPVYQSMQADGNKVILSFTHTGSGLMIRDKYGYIKGFEVAGDDHQFHYAKANIEGDHIVVAADSVAHPVAVRYAWADDAGEANLYNKEGFPAAPFRTDTWKGITEEAKYSIAK